MARVSYFQRQPSILILVEALVAVAIIGFFDLITAYEVSLSIIYGVPIYAAAWYIDKKSGILIALISGIVWWWASIAGGHSYPSNFLEAWETFARLCYFIFIAIGAASLRRERDTAEMRIALLEHSRTLEREIVDISEREQRRIGRDLHDDLCQHQAALACAAASLHADLDKKHLIDEARRADQLAKRLRDAVVHTRGLARGLVPVEMEERGLISALHELASTVSELHSVACDFYLRGESPILENSAATHLYRIAQEAINNGLRHGKAKRIELQLSAADGATTLRVSDDGVGISNVSRSDRGMGMNIMIYRAKLLGGNLVVEEPGEGGTTISCIIRTNDKTEHERAA